MSQIPDALEYWKSLNPDQAASETAAPANPYGMGSGPASTGGGANPYGQGPATTQGPAGGGPSVPDALTYWKTLNPDDTTKTDETKTQQKPPPPKSLTDFLINQTPHSFVNFFKNIGSAIAHPINTDEALTNTVKGALKYAGRAVGFDLPEDEADRQARAYAQLMYNRYGSWDKVGESLYHDPVGTLADASMAASGAGAVVRGLGTAADVAGAARTAEAMGTLGKTLTTAGNVLNPVYLPSKAVSAPLRAFMPKREAPLPAFDPRTATFEGPPGAPPPATPDPVQRLRAQWGIKNPPSGLGQPEPSPQPSPTPPAPGVPQQVWGFLKQIGIGGMAGELLTHSLTGGAYGMLTGAALKALPMFLKTDMGQQMLSRIGPGSNAAAVGAVARDMVPALNMFGRNYEASMSSRSVFDTRATGGVVNPDPELARIQRERLRLPGILETLGNFK